jgi:hypothetical protein
MHYRIKPGYSFRDSDDSIKTGGELIELSPDVAAQHAEKVEVIEAGEQVADKVESDSVQASATFPFPAIAPEA